MLWEMGASVLEWNVAFCVSDEGLLIVLIPSAVNSGNIQ